jgi:glyoxylase-like metal-dependent hydrolase (beta-lactamase superfamily II)
MRARLTTILALAGLVLPACQQEASRAPEGSAALAPGRRARDLETYGQDLSAAVTIAPAVHQARGTGNAHLVVTPAGNVVIDTGLPTQAERLRELLRAVDPGPVRYVILTHAHIDHAGGAGRWLEEGTEVVAHREFAETQRYLTDLFPYMMRRNRIFYPINVPELPFGLAERAIQRLYPNAEPSIVVDDVFAFELGGVRFEAIATPGAEGGDSLSVWLPQQKILFTGDLFGPVFPMWPNLYTLRGEKTRFVVPYLRSLEAVLELGPEILVPGHFEPVVGAERIRDGVERMRDAVLYVHDATVAGMNSGKDVHTLMREIRLPPDLALSEVHGKVSWGVRSIWEGYTGWFYFDSTTELYPIPASSIHADLAELAGGPGALARRAAARVGAGQPVEALHLVKVALAGEPGHRAALEARLAALELLLERSHGVNHHEVLWLEDRIARTREALGS